MCTMLWNCCCPDIERGIARSVADLGQCSPSVTAATAEGGMASPEEAAEATLFLAMT